MTRTCKHCGTSIEGSLPKRIYCSKPCGNHASKNKRHGLTGTKEYAAWTGMRERCRNPSCHNYARYGGRGIKICERWDSFENFYADMGSKPKGYSIERENNDGNYEPSNCRWATRAEQNKNRSISYTVDEDQKIRQALERKLNFRQIAGLLDGRTAKSVEKRTYTLSLRSFARRGRALSAGENSDLHVRSEEQP